MEKYNCVKIIDHDTGSNYTLYKDLIASAKYQSEVSAYKIRQKKHENRAKEDEAKQAQHKVGYAAFKKMKAEERE